MRNYINFIFLAAFVLLFASLTYKDQVSIQIDENTPLWQVLEYFGEPAPNHKPEENIKGASAEKGKDLVSKGVTRRRSGGKTKRLSKHFVCTSCHNVQREDPDLRLSDPQARLEYARDNGLPFLQGTSLYGAVNRTSFYNDDYEKKYGKLVAPTRNNLREAIQLCAIECSQGRKLKAWEIESVLMYLWTLELKMGDLNLEEQDYQKIREAASKSGMGKDQESINYLKSFYQSGAPAHFVMPPEDRKTGGGLVGDPKNGKLVYKLSCLHCHENKRYSQFSLEDNKLSHNFLKNHFTQYFSYSVYQVARYGTSPLPGKNAYMPQYTREKLSDQMLEDLRAYVEGGNVK